MGSVKHTLVQNKEGLLLGSIEGYEDECRCSAVLGDKIKMFLRDIKEFAGKVWEMGSSDPRKVIFAIKMGLALAFVSLLIIFYKESDGDTSQYAIWAILTVVVVFEFSIGSTFFKGINRGLGTICAAMFAFCFAELSALAGKWEEVVIVISNFLAGFCSSYLKLYPTMRPYEYGFRVFLITYCILMVAGNRKGEYKEAIFTRLLLIAMGACICFVVNICIYPIWSGEDLHMLVVKNFKGVANSLEGCVTGYLKCVEYERVPSKILTYQASDDLLYSGYRSVVESKSQEETLLNFAVWEPPHGRYRMCNYPWKYYVKLSGALRHCAFTVMALHGCILSEIQAPAERRQVFRNELEMVGAKGAKVLRDLGNKIEKMEKLSPGDILKEVNEAAEQLQNKIDQRSYLLVNAQKWEIGTSPREIKDLESLVEAKDDAIMQLGIKSFSETVLDLRSVQEWEPYQAPKESSEDNLGKQASWPSRVSTKSYGGINEEQLRTYESASALSLASFASLLMEFVARLQNVVHTFEELSQKANFKDPVINTMTPAKNGGFWTCC